MGQRKSEQSGRRHENADSRNQSRAKSAGEPVGQQAGHDRPAGDDHRHDPCKRNRDAQIGMHDRPCGPDQGIGQPEADECDINDGKQ